MLVVCDFDGTITDRDLTDQIWDRYLPDDVRRDLVARVTAGELSMLEFIGGGYEHVPKTPEQILKELEGSVQIRPGFDALVTASRAGGWPIHIVSCGLDFYLRKFLPYELPLDCFALRFDGKWRIELPNGVALPPGEEFKAHRVRALRADHRSELAAYIGDGRADFEPAQLCDRIYAVRESRLAKLCRQAAVPCTEFADFEELVPELVRLGGR